MIWRRTLLLTLVLMTGLLLETTLLGSRTLGGTKPEIILLVAIALGMAEGPSEGAVAGFVGGLATDLLLNLPRGLSALSFTTIGYIVGALREQYQGGTAWLPIVIAGVATAAGVFTYGAAASIFGQVGIPISELARHAGLAAGYNMLLAPFVVPAVRKLAKKLQPRKVVRL